MHMVEKILNNTTPYGKIRASHEGSLHSSTLKVNKKWLFSIVDWKHQKTTIDEFLIIFLKYINFNGIL